MAGCNRVVIDFCLNSGRAAAKEPGSYRVPTIAAQAGEWRRTTDERSRQAGKLRLDVIAPTGQKRMKNTENNHHSHQRQGKRALGRASLLAAACLVLCAFPLSSQTPPMPALEHQGKQFHLMVDGKPYLMLGGQAHNSSATNVEDLDRVMASLNALHANTAEVPIYWELIEPQPGHYDFQTVDRVVDAARRARLRLVLLWFGSWKNGEMHYTPEWLKRDPKTYQRVTGPRGESMEIISPLCEACRKADAAAFAAVMGHLRSTDENQRTVIMMQVENETGLLGTDRDYAPEATRQFEGSVPAPLMHYLAAHRSTLTPDMNAAWSLSGYHTSGTWTEVFGDMAAEAYSAWGVASYVDAVAAAGKQAYPLPFYCNNWLAGEGVERAGRWPSGGPTIHVLDVWKAAAPHVDVLAADIYAPQFVETSAIFTRPDNPLFVPETAFVGPYAAYAFTTFATFNGIGFSPFGIDRALENGKLSEAAQPLASTYALLQPLLPLITRLQYTGKLHAVVQDLDWAKAIRLSPQVAAVVSFGSPYTAHQSFLTAARGRGMILELGKNDYVVAGAGFSVAFREMQGPLRDAEILSVEEGTFQDGEWVTKRRLNGDELHVSLPGTSGHVGLASEGSILRVKLLP